MAAKLFVCELSKKYDAFLALAPITIQIETGKITTISGPNGSGKTTFLSCISGLVCPSEGTVSVDGFDLYENEVEFHRRLVFVPDVPRFYLELTAWEHLQFVAMANDAVEDFDRRAEDLLKKLDLWEARNLFPHNFSRGMRLKMGLALALIRPFSVLLLDEPTSALDTAGTELLISELIRLRQEEVTILLSTHDDALKTRLGDHHLKIDNGSIELE